MGPSRRYASLCRATPALPASPKAQWSHPLHQARRALGVVGGGGGGYCKTYFGAACAPACSRGICKHYRTPSPGVSASKSGLRPVTCRSAVCVCLHVCACQYFHLDEWPAVWYGSNDNLSFEVYSRMIDLMIMSPPVPLPGSRIYCMGPWAIQIWFSDCV